MKLARAVDVLWMLAILAGTFASGFALGHDRDRPAPLPPAPATPTLTDTCSPPPHTGYIVFQSAAGVDTQPNPSQCPDVR